MKYYYDDIEFGRISVELRRGMKKYHFHVKDGRLFVRMPNPYNLDDFKGAINRNREGLRALIEEEAKAREQNFYYDGKVIPYIGGGTITIDHDPNEIDTIEVRFRSENEGVILLGTSLTYDMALTKKQIIRGVNYLLGNPLLYVVFPMAKQIARELNLPVRYFEPGFGLQKFGHCTTGNVIRLSRVLALLPEHLIRFVIYHELAHITYQDHSPAFHRLVDKYTGGREKELEKELKQFNWPILRRY